MECAVELLWSPNYTTLFDANAIEIKILQKLWKRTNNHIFNISELETTGLFPGCSK